MTEYIIDQSNLGDINTFQDLGGLFYEPHLEMLGDNAEEKAIVLSCWLSAFAPDPATFDVRAFKEIVYDSFLEDYPDMPSLEQTVVFATESGLIQEIGNNRYSTNPFVYKIIEDLYEKDEEGPIFN